MPGKEITPSYATRMLPYRGLGLGIMNALNEQSNIEFYPDVQGEQFKVVIPRPEENGKIGSFKNDYQG